MEHELSQALKSADSVLILAAVKQHDEKLRQIELKLDALIDLSIHYRLQTLKEELADHEKRLRDNEKFRWVLHGISVAIAVAMSILVHLIWKSE